MSQAAVMLAAEGNAWFERNREKLGVSDPVCEVLTQNNVRPTSVAEIGCANGWRLAKLRDMHRCEVTGLDASEAAVKSARDDITIAWGTADRLPWVTRSFDLVIYGFCLYLCDRADLLHIVSEGDRVLRDGGHLVVHDFYEYDRDAAYRVPYAHRLGMWSYHMNHHNLWLAHPSYRRIGQAFGEDNSAAILLKKDHASAWPVVK